MAEDEKSATGRVHALDGVRGVAALAVGVFHGILHYDEPAVQRVFGVSVFDVSGYHDSVLKFLLIFFNGEAAVILFFVLSGLVLARSLDRLNHVSAPRVAIDFTVKRLLRIYPAVIATMIVLYLAVLIFAPNHNTTFPHYTLRDIGLAAALWDVRIDGPLYTLQVELCAVPFLLIAYLLRRKLGGVTDFVLIFYALLALQIPALAFGFGPFAANLLAFACGTVLAHRAVSGLVAGLGKFAWIFSLVVFLGLPQLLSHQMYTVMLSQVFSGALVVGIVAYTESPLSKMMSSRIALFYGRISFSYYLFNVIGLMLAWAAINKVIGHPYSNPTKWGALSAVIAVAIATPLSMLSERYIEQPGISLGRWLTAKRPARRKSLVSDVAP